MGEPEAPAPRGAADVYFLLVAASNLVTALVPSETACLASSPGRMRRTAVWTSRELEDMVNKIGDQKGAPFGCSTG